MSLTGSCFSSESAPRPFHHRIRRRGGTIFWAVLPLVKWQNQAECELTSSIVPRGTSFHCSVDLGLPPIALILCALHAGAVSLVQRTRCRQPSAVQDHGQPTRQGHDRLFQPAAPGDLHGPGFEPGPFLRTQHCSAQLRRASPASSHLRSVISCRSNRSHPTDTWRTSAEIPPRLPWIFGIGQACRRWRDRSAPPRGRHRGRH